MTLLDKVRSIFLDSKLPNSLWSEAVNTSNYLTNRSPTSANEGIIPFQILFGKPPNLKHVRIFGLLAHVHVNKKYRNKMESRSILCTLVGYDETTKAYRLYNHQMRKIVVSRDVKFNEKLVGVRQPIVKGPVV
jgi:hypothetical protein